MNGAELSRGYYEAFGRPMLEEQFPELLPFLAVGLCGSGSECFGWDDEISRDHDFEPGFCIFLPEEAVIDRRQEFLLERAYAKLPREYEGFHRQAVSPAGGARHGVFRAEEFFCRYTGHGDGCLSTAEWLTIPEQSLAEATNGAVYWDGSGCFSDVRERLSCFPEEIRLKKLSSCLMQLGQCGSYNYSRCLSHGETGAAQLALYAFAEHAAHLVFLLENRYMPYYKWRFRALRESKPGSEIAGFLEYLISTGNDPDTADNKRWVLEEVTSILLAELMGQELSDATCMDTGKHAQSVNDRIGDPVLRNMPI